MDLVQNLHLFFEVGICLILRIDNAADDRDAVGNEEGVHDHDDDLQHLFGIIHRQGGPAAHGDRVIHSCPVHEIPRLVLDSERQVTVRQPVLFIVFGESQARPEPRAVA